MRLSLQIAYDLQRSCGSTLIIHTQITCIESKWTGMIFISNKFTQNGVENVRLQQRCYNVAIATNYYNLHATLQTAPYDYETEC